MAIGQKLLEGKKEFAEGWNFGPSDEGSISVQKVVEQIKKYWENIDYDLDVSQKHPHEANLLKLDCSKAHIKLHWQNVWSSETTFEKTVNWYKIFYQDQELITFEDLQSYISDARDKHLEWTV